MHLPLPHPFTPRLQVFPIPTPVTLLASLGRQTPVIVRSASPRRRGGSLACLVPLYFLLEYAPCPARPANFPQPSLPGFLPKNRRPGNSHLASAATPTRAAGRGGLNRERSRAQAQAPRGFSGGQEPIRDGKWELFVGDSSSETLHN